MRDLFAIGRHNFPIPIRKNSQHSKEHSSSHKKKEEEVKKINDYGVSHMPDYAPELLNTPSAHFVEVKRGSDS